MEHRPHVSAALAHLRHGVTFSALTVGVCAIAQLVVFGFVHFTQVRWASDVPQTQTQQFSVVATPVSRKQPEFNVRKDIAAEPDGGAGLDAAGGESLVKPALPASPRGPVATELRRIEPPRVPGTGDVYLRRCSNLAVTVGIVATITLGLLTMMGVVVAGGACVPGVEKAVTAATWAVVMGLLAFPWRDVLESMPFPGVFGGYSAMTAASAGVDAGMGSSAAMFASHLLMPFGVLITSILVALRFHAGVEQGVIVTSVSELDEALEREMAGIRRRGVGSNIGSRAVGVLNQAIGDRSARSVEEPAAVKAASARERRVGEADPGEPLKRPI